jgi:hypothetical protein
MQGSFAFIIEEQRKLRSVFVIDSSYRRCDMKQSFGRIWIVATVALLPFASACFGDSITVPKDTDVPLVFDEAVSSKTAKAGDKVMLHVAEDIKLGGHTVIREGAKVTAIVSSVEKRKNFGVNGKLRLAFEAAHSARGQSIPIEPKTAGKYTGSRTDKAAYASGGGALLLGPVGLVGGYFVVGKNVNIKAGERIMCEVARDTALTSR